MTTREQAEQNLKNAEAQARQTHADWQEVQERGFAVTHERRFDGVMEALATKPEPLPVLTCAEANLRVEQARMALAALDCAPQLAAAKQAALRVEATRTEYQSALKVAEDSLKPLYAKYIDSLNASAQAVSAVPQGARDLAPAPASAYRQDNGTVTLLLRSVR
jgi:hypothetical protein